MWHYGKDGQQLGPFPEWHMVGLIKSGAVRADTLVWKQGMAGWIPASESDLAPHLAAAAAPPPPAPAAPGATPAQGQRPPPPPVPVAGAAGIRPPPAISPVFSGHNLAGWRPLEPLVAPFLVLMVLMCLTDLFSLCTEIFTLKVMAEESMLNETQEKMLMFRDIALGFLYLFILVPLIVIFCMFTYRANRNLQLFGHVALRFTPGWAVGWNFVPFMNLVRPYQAMREILNGSLDPDRTDLSDNHTTQIVWWTLWILCWVSVALMVADILPSDSTGTAWISIVDLVLSISLNISAFVVLREIASAQSALYKAKTT